MISKIKSFCKIFFFSGNFIIEKIVTENFISTKKYAVNLENIIKNLQIKVFEKILNRTYSPYHVRIFRILMKFQHLDDKKVKIYY